MFPVKSKDIKVGTRTAILQAFTTFFTHIYAYPNKIIYCKQHNNSKSATTTTTTI